MSFQISPEQVKLETKEIHSLILITGVFVSTTSSHRTRKSAHVYKKSNTVLLMNLVLVSVNIFTQRLSGDMMSQVYFGMMACGLVRFQMHLTRKMSAGHTSILEHTVPLKKELSRCTTFKVVNLDSVSTPHKHTENIKSCFSDKISQQ